MLKLEDFDCRGIDRDNLKGTPDETLFWYSRYEADVKKNIVVYFRPFTDTDGIMAFKGKGKRVGTVLQKDGTNEYVICFAGNDPYKTDLIRTDDINILPICYELTDICLTEDHPLCALKVPFKPTQNNRFEPIIWNLGVDKYDSNDYISVQETQDLADIVDSTSELGTFMPSEQTYTILRMDYDGMQTYYGYNLLINLTFTGDTIPSLSEGACNYPLLFFNKFTNPTMQKAVEDKGKINTLLDAAALTGAAAK